MKKALNIPALICVAIAALLWLVIPYAAETSYLEAFKEILSHMGELGDAFAFVATDLFLSLVTLVAIILCAVFTFTNNKKALNASAILGIVGPFVAIILGSFMLSSKLSVGFGDVFSPTFKALEVGFWISLIPFAGILFLNNKAAE